MTDFTPRPTVYNGIKMRSRLEATYAASLDNAGIAWEYEPGAFATPGGQYLPDFRLNLTPDGLTRVYIEVKPTDEMALAAAPKMEIIHGSEPGSHLVVVAPHGDWPNLEFHPVTWWEHGRFWADTAGRWSTTTEAPVAPTRRGPLLSKGERTDDLYKHIGYFFGDRGLTRWAATDLATELAVNHGAFDCDIEDYYDAGVVAYFGHRAAFVEMDENEPITDDDVEMAGHDAELLQAGFSGLAAGGG